MDTLSSLPNIGAVTEEELLRIKVDTPEKLRQLGSKAVFLQLRKIDPGACLHLLYGLQGAIEGVRYTQLSDETLQDLRQFFRSLEA